MATPEQIPSDLTLEIETNLSPDTFLAASRNFFGFIEEIAEAADVGEKLEWQVKVREGSNLLALEPVGAPAHQNFERVFANARHATNRLLAGDVDGAGLTERALGFIKGLSQLSDRGKRSTFVRLWIERQPLDIRGTIAATIQEHWRSDYHDFGSVEGKLEAIQDSAGLQLRVRDNLFNALVKCVLPDDMLKDAFASFRKRVEISGLVHYRANGTPISISVERLAPLPDDDDLPSYHDVRGILAA
jgi:hypothetical protein